MCEPKEKKVSEQLNTLEWMRENELVWTKPSMQGNTMYNVFDCRDSTAIKLIASFATFDEMCKFYKRRIPW